MSLDWPRFSGPLREPVDADREREIADEKADHDYNIMKNDDKTPTEWVQQFHPPGQTRDCIHFRLARSCEICGLERELFYSRSENDALCAFINRKMKMTRSDPRIEELVKRVAGATTPPPTEEFRPTRGYEQVVSLEDYQKLQRELAEANKEADKEHAKAVELCDKLIDLRQR